MARPDPTLPDFPYAYWVLERRLLAGGYVGDWDEDRARAKIGVLLDAGIRVFIDLTEAGEWPVYADYLQDEAAARGIEVEYQRSPIRDHGVPDSEQLSRILDALDAALGAGRPVYVHCFGGIGRTGTIIGCWLAENGYVGEAALERLASLRCDCPDRGRDSPETEAQREIVRRWSSR